MSIIPVSATRMARQTRLATLEKEIAAGADAFFRVGQALLEVKRDELWREAGCLSWEAYVTTRWSPKITRGRADQLIKASIVSDTVRNSSTTVDPKGLTEGLLRPLEKFVSVRAGGRTVDVREVEIIETLERATDLARAAGTPLADKFVRRAAHQVIMGRKADDIEPAAPWAGDFDLGRVYVADVTSPEFLSSIPEASVALVISDPPWAEAGLRHYATLGRIAMRALVPGGVLCAYAGKVYLPAILSALSVYLTYEWTVALSFPAGQVRMRKASFYCCWRPVAVFRKAGAFVLPDYEPDLMASAHEKHLHDWQQAIAPARRLVRRYSQPGDVVLDPFAGAGTFPLAAKLEGRRFVGFEVDPATAALAERRIAESDNEPTRVTFRDAVEEEKG